MLKQENAHAWIRIARGSDQCHGCGPGNIWPVATRGIRDCEQWFPTIGGPVFDPERHFRSSFFHVINQRCGPGCGPVLQYLARGSPLTPSKRFNFFLRAASSHSNNDAPAHKRVWQPTKSCKRNGTERLRFHSLDRLPHDHTASDHCAASITGIE